MSPLGRKVRRVAAEDGAAGLAPGPGGGYVLLFLLAAGEWPRGAGGLRAYHPSDASVPSLTTS